jgi:hypothetical protein
MEKNRNKKSMAASPGPILPHLRPTSTFSSHAAQTHTPAPSSADMWTPRGQPLFLLRELLSHRHAGPFCQVHLPQPDDPSSARVWIVTTRQIRRTSLAEIPCFGPISSSAMRSLSSPVGACSCHQNGHPPPRE